MCVVSGRGLLHSGVAVVFLLVIGQASLVADDWPQWRGPHRNGVSAETGLLARWPAGGPKLQRKITGLGDAYASVVVADGRIFTIGKEGTVVFARARAVEDGRVLWDTTIGKTGRKALSTPTVDGRYVYVLDPDGNLHCLAVANGMLIWKRSFAGEFGGKLQNGRGYAESPLIDGAFLVGTPGGSTHTMVKLDKRTGKTVWSCQVPVFGPRGRPGAGFASPVAVTVGKVRTYVQFLGRGVVGVRAADGKFLWGYNRFPSAPANIPTPVVIGDRLFVANGYNAGSALLKMVPDGKGGVGVREEYFLSGRKFQNHHGGFVHVDGHIFGGHGSNLGLPTCLDLETGDVLWKRRGPGAGSASVIYAEGHLYMRYANGVLALVAASAEGYRLKGTFRVPGAANDSWSHPALANGRLYLRENDSLYIHDVRATK